MRAAPARLACSLKGHYPTAGARPVQEEEDRTSPTLFDVEENDRAEEPRPYLPCSPNGIPTPHPLPNSPPALPASPIPHLGGTPPPVPTPPNSLHNGWGAPSPGITGSLPTTPAPSLPPLSSGGSDDEPPDTFRGRCF